jgi:hypothetical protein
MFVDTSFCCVMANEPVPTDRIRLVTQLCGYGHPEQYGLINSTCLPATPSYLAKSKISNDTYELRQSIQPKRGAAALSLQEEGSAGAPTVQFSCDWTSNQQVENDMSTSTSYVFFALCVYHSNETKTGTSSGNGICAMFSPSASTHGQKLITLI